MFGRAGAERVGGYVPKTRRVTADVLGAGKFKPSPASCIGRVCVETDGWSVTRREEAEVNAAGLEITTCEKDGECAAPTPIRCDCWSAGGLLVEERRLAESSGVSIRKENQTAQSKLNVEKIHHNACGWSNDSQDYRFATRAVTAGQAASVRVYAHSLEIQMEANER